MKTWGLLLLCAVTVTASADKLYTWVDDQGHVHYTQTPPPDAGTKAKAVEIHVAPADPAAVQAAQAQQAQAAQNAAVPPDPQQVAIQQRCAGLRAQMSAYTHSDAAPSAERTQAIADLKAQIAKECN